MTDGSPAELARRIQLLDFQLMGLLGMRPAIPY